MSKFSFMVSGSVICQWIEQKLNRKNTGCLFICFCSFRHASAELLGHLEVLVCREYQVAQNIKTI